MASSEATSSNDALCSYELVTLCEHFDLIVTSIKDPDALAEAACKVNLISSDVKDVIVQYGCFNDAQTKTRSLLQIIEGKVKGSYICFHQFLAVLRSFSELYQLASRLQTSYDRRVMGTPCRAADVCGEEDLNSRSEAEASEHNSDGSSVVCDGQQSEQDRNGTNFQSVDNSKLDEESAADVKREAISLSAKYRSIGVVLGLRATELDKIDENCPHNCDKAFSQVIDTWLKQGYDISRHGHPSWKKLVEAVDSEAGGKNPALAMRIADAHRAGRKRQPISSEGDPQPKRPCIEDGPLGKFRPKLADLYSKKPEVPEGTWPPVRKTQFINLAVIKKTAINFAKDDVRQTIHGSIDDIIKDKEMIDYSDAFDEVEDGALVLMEGRPGCGKTTLMHKLSQDWEKGEILASRLFLLVHFRRFSNRSDVTLSDILRSASGNLTDDDIRQLCSHIEESSGRGVVFALDGLDEYSPKLSANLLHKLIKRECLTNSVVIIASRPAASQKFRKYAMKHVEVLGFLSRQIKDYVENYFNESPDKAQDLLRYLEHHLNVMHMCYLPLHSAMVTYLYDMEGDNLPQTETEIYKHFTLWTLIRSLKKRSDDPDAPFMLSDFDELSCEDKKVFDLILKLAYNATINSKQVFTLKEVKEYVSKELPSTSSGSGENSLGLIVIDRYFVKYGLDQIYTFLHLTFQEYLAAYWVSNQTEENQAEILRTHGSNENLAEVWKFFCGIGKCSPQNFSILLRKAQCDIRAVKNRSRNITVPNSSLHLHCAYESQKDWMCSQVVEKCESSITLRDRSLTPSDMTALGYVIAHSEMPIKELHVTSCHLGVEGLTALVTEIGDKKLSLEELSFSGTKIKQEMVEKFAAFFTICSSVTTLDLSSSVSKSTLTDICNKISGLPSLTTLNISSNRLGNTGSAVKAFLDKLPKLQTLKIHLYKDIQWYLSMKDKGQLRDINVETLVEHTPLGESWQDLATCTELVLRRQKINDNEAKAIGERLKECTNLSSLYLNDNQIGDTGAQAIGEGCKLCPNLQKISLDNNQIGDTGAQAIAEGCKLCPNLQKIWLLLNSITDASVPHLIGLMETARKLEELYIGGNKFTEVGKSQLRQAQEKRNNDQANYVRLGLGV